MALEREYAPAMQIEDERVLERCRLALHEDGIDYHAVPLSKVPLRQLPEWIRPGDGGWLLMIEKAQFNEGMKRLDELMGRSDDHRAD